MEITLSAFTLYPSCDLPTDTGTIRAYYDRSFLSDGLSVVGSSTFSDNFFNEFSWAKDPDTGLLTAESSPIITTVNSSQPDANLTLTVYDSNGTSYPSVYVYSGPVFNSLGPVVSLEDLQTYVDALSVTPPTPRDSSWVDVVNSLIQSALGSRNYADTDTLGLVFTSVTPAIADEPIVVGDNDPRLDGLPIQDASTTVKGIVKLSSAPVAPTNPIAVAKTDYATSSNSGITRLSTNPLSASTPIAYGVNDTKQPALTSPIYYASQYASFNAAVTAIGSTPAVLIVDQLMTLVTTVSIPATLVLQFTGAGAISLVNANTVTILGPVVAPVKQIFANAISGQGTVSFSGNNKLSEIFPEWWGAVANGSTNCNPAITAAVTALPSASPGINGGVVKLGIGNYRVTGLTITDIQAHLIGSGGIGEAGGSNTASTIISSISNAPILKYAQGSLHSYRCRLENINFVGSTSAGTSQHCVWVDNGGIILNNVSLNNAGGHGLLLTRSDVGAYYNLEVHESHLDSVRLDSTLSSGTGSTQRNTFVNVSIGACSQTGLHFVTGHGNMVFGLDVENSAGRPIWFDRDASVTSEVTYNYVYGFWEEMNSGNVDFNGTSQNNYVQFVHPDYTPTVTVGSPGTGNRYDSPASYGTPATERFGRVVIGNNSATIPGADGLTVCTGNISFSNSTQMLSWGAGLAKLGVTSSTNINFVDSTGTTAGSINLGLGTALFTQILRNGTGVDIRNGDNSAYGALAAKAVRGAAVAFANLPTPIEGMMVAVTDSNTATWGANIAGGGSNHVLAYYNGTAWTVAGK